MTNLDISHLTDIGSRNTNEDKILVKCLDGIHLLAVADGMGGHAAGEVASGVALLEIEKFLEQNLKEADIRDQVVEAVDRANKEIYLLSKENDEYAGMGTTLVMALIQRNQVLIANVGDSRAYLLSGTKITQITKDHSATQELLDIGIITEEEVKQHPLRSTLTRVLGSEREIKADFYDVVLKPGDILVLCSDGLTDSLEDKVISEVVYSAANLNEACAGLIKRAKKEGSKDNISVILAGVK